MLKKIMRAVRSKTKEKISKEEIQRKKKLRTVMQMPTHRLLDLHRYLVNPKRLSNNHTLLEQMARTDKLFLRACQVKWEPIHTRKA